MADPTTSMMIARPTRPDTVLLAVGVIAVSTSGPLMAAAVAPALAIAFWRNALGTAATAPLLVARPHRREIVSMTRRQRRMTVLAGVLLALHFSTWVPSLTLTSVASATAIVCLQPVWAAILARLRGYPVSPRTWLGIVISIAGAVLLTGVDLTTGGDALIGNLLALVGGIMGAGYVVVGEEVRQSLGTVSYTTLCYATAAVLLAVACVVSGAELGGYDDRTWWLLIAVTVGPQLLGHSIFNRVLRTVSSVVVSLVILFEIPGAAFMAWLWLDQELSALAFPAMALLLAGLALVVSAPAQGTPVSLPTD